jgi:hypothetical protein
MNFWDYEIWDAMLQTGFLLAVLLIANIMRRKIPLLKKSLLPSAVIAGFLALILKESGIFETGFISGGVMEALTYHTLGLGFIAIALKTSKEKITKERQKGIFDSGVFLRGLIDGIRRQKGLQNIQGEILSFPEFKEREYDRLADIVRHNSDMTLFYDILKGR